VIEGEIPTMHAAAAYMDRLPTEPSEAGFELFYASLFHPGRGFAFPCDATGKVKLAQLSDRGFSNYLHSVDAVGIELGQPQVKPRPFEGC
jgi:hypothetical protein